MQGKNLKIILIAVACISGLVISVVFIIIFQPLTPGGPASIIDGPTIYNHNCTDYSEIPLAWIDAVQDRIKLHYAHTSHGEQLTEGLQRIETADSTYSQVRGECYLPTEVGALNICDGQPGFGGNDNETYITPDLYWEDETALDRTRDVLDNIPVNVSMWCWCTQLDELDLSQTQAYLDAISTLEAEYTNVTFIYMTGNAQATGAMGYNRYLRNQYIREYCKNNSKYLFDFADIDCWYNGEQSTYLYNGISVPYEHPHYGGDEAGHTTYESCELKGAVVWWMLANLTGWATP